MGTEDISRNNQENRRAKIISRKMFFKVIFCERRE